MERNRHAHLEATLASWRQGSGESVAHREEAESTEAFLRNTQRRIGVLCKNHVLDHAAFFADLQAIARDEWGDRELAQRVTDMCTYALKHYEASTGLALTIATEQEIKRFLRDIGNHTLQPPPLP